MRLSERSKPKWLDLQEVLGDRLWVMGLGAVAPRWTGGWAVVEGVNLGWFGDSDGVSVGVAVRLSKIRGGRLLTGVGGDGSTEDRVGLRALRHHVVGARRLRAG